MSEWTDRTENHRIWGLMKSFGPLLDEALRFDPLPPEDREGINRLMLVLAVCGKRLGSIDRSLIPIAALDLLAGSFESQINEVQAYLSDHNSSHFSNANVSADTVLSNLPAFPQISSPEELIELFQVIKRQRKQTEEQLQRSAKWDDDITRVHKALEEYGTKSQDELAAIREALAAEKAKTAIIITDQQKLFADAQAAQNSTYSDTLSKIQESLAKTISEQQGQFSTAQENRNRDFATSLSDLQKHHGELLTEHSKRLGETDAAFKSQIVVATAENKSALVALSTKYESEAATILDDVREKQDQVQKLVGVIGVLGVTSGYQKTANSAKWSMRIWQGITVAAMIVLIDFAYDAFLPTLKDAFTWEAFAARVFTTIAVGVLAAYAGSQADRFFKIEKYNRRMELELAAIDPFIALLPLEEQQKFKLEVGRRSFGQEDNTGTDNKSPATTVDVLASKEGKDMFQLVLDMARKFTKGQ